MAAATIPKTPLAPRCNSAVDTDAGTEHNVLACLIRILSMNSFTKKGGSDSF